LNEQALEAPSRYLDAMPGKGIRDKAIDTLNSRFKLPADQIIAIKKVVNLLHGASLMLDDIQDSSQLRRGKPAAHMVFGTMQTINTAGYRFLGALSEVMSLGSEKCLEVFRGKVLVYVLHLKMTMVC
jgi:fusicocca-2,10(14)-diene synthase/ophiobolin F synthase